MTAARIGAATVVLLALGCARPLATLRIDGSAGVAPLVSALSTAYRERHPSAMIVMGGGLGSSARLQAVQEGRIDIAMASHGLDSADLARRGLVARRIARTAVVFAVSADVPLSAITSARLCDIYAGRVRSWRELGGPDLPIRAIMRPRGEVDADVVLAGIPCLATLTLAGSVQVIERPDEMARVLSTTPGAFGVTSAPMVEQSGGRFTALSLDGIAPGVENVASGAYPLSRDAVLVFKAPAPRLVERLLEFVSSVDGERIIRANGAVPST